LLRDTPDISVSVVEDLDDRILSMLRSRELDLVVSRLGVNMDYPDVKTEPLLLADWSLILRADHPLARLSSVSLKDLDGVKWVLPAGGSAFRRQLENMFAQPALAGRLCAINTNSILAMKSIVMSSDCVTIMSPRLVEVEREVGRICVT
jgi:LysR family transcriptional regulator of gallate degradation